MTKIITSSPIRHSRSREAAAFTLLEVMIASGIFFMAIFAILALVSSNLRNARLLQQPHVDGGIILADICQTNQLTEGSQSGTLDDLGPAYSGYTWDCQITQVDTNGFFLVECLVTRPGGGPNNISTISTFLYRPDSPTTSGR